MITVHSLFYSISIKQIRKEGNMNSCILMGKIVRSPELRYTQENQTPIAQMLIEFEGTSPSDPVATLKVVAWGNMAMETKEKYTEGDRVIIEGRLSMNRFERQEGLKETRAELVVSHIYPLGSNLSASVSSQTYTPHSDNVVPMKKPMQTTTTQEFDYSTELETENTISEEEYSHSETTTVTQQNSNDKDLDDIPF